MCKSGLQNWTARVQTPAQQLFSSVTLAKLPNIPVLQFSHLQNENTYKFDMKATWTNNNIKVADGKISCYY